MYNVIRSSSVRTRSVTREDVSSTKLLLGVAIFLAALMVVLCSASVSDATDDANGGRAGDCVWNYANGKLIIMADSEGSGIMDDYDLFSNTPWSSYQSEITTVEIQGGVTNVGSHAFDGCSNLTTVNIASSVTSIGDYAFKGTGLKSDSITGMTGVQTIGSCAFQDCKSLESMSLSKVTTIESSAFSGCTELTTISFPSVSQIGSNAFSGCDKLTSIDIPSTAAIGSGAFSIATATIDAIGAMTYTGSELKPTLTITWAGRTLELTTNYTVSYSDNVHASNNAKVIVTGKGSFSGTTTVTFTINPKTVDVPTPATDLVYNGTDQSAFSTSSYYDIADGKKSDAGDYTAILTLKNESGHTDIIWSDSSSGTQEIKWSIAKRPITFTSYSYSGVYDAIEHKITVKVTSGSFASTDVGKVTFTSTGQTNVCSGVATTFTVEWDTVNKDNYDVTEEQNATITITKKALTFDSASAKDKEYNGTTDVNVTLGNLVGICRVDEGYVSLTSWTASAAKNVGINAVVFKNLALTGDKAKNYSLTIPELEVNVTPATLTITAEAADRAYDGTTDVTKCITLGDLTGVFDVDYGKVTVKPGWTASVPSKDADTYTVTISTLVLVGDEAGNYTLTQPDAPSITITKKELTLPSAKVGDKVYDGLVAISEDLVDLGYLSGVVGSEDVKIADGWSATSVKTVGTNAVTFTGLTLTGNDMKNYTLKDPELEVKVTPKSVQVSDPTLASKTYDGTTSVGITAHGSVTKCGDDDLTLVTSQAVAVLDAAGAGSRTATFSGYSLTGADAGNYTLVQPASQKVTVAKAKVTVTPTAYSGTYDAKAHSATFAVTGLVDGESVSVETGSYTDAGSYDVTAEIVWDNADKNNYTVTGPLTSTVTIDRLALTISGTAVDGKVYDGNTEAVVHAGTLQNVVSGDTVYVTSATGTFAGKTVGSWDVTVKYTLSSANYTLADQTIKNVSISKRTVTVDGTTVDGKTYDSTVTATVHAGTLQDVVSGDDLGFTAEAKFDTKNVGTYKTVTVTYILTGTSKDNYDIADATFHASITAKTLTVSGTSATKEYDGTTTLTSDEITVGSLVGVFVADKDKVSVEANGGYFDTKAVGTTKVFHVWYNDLGGDEAGNYVLQSYEVTLNTGSVTAKALSVSGSKVVTKTYDGTTAADVHAGNLSEYITGDTVYATASGFFEDQNAGEGKKVFVTYTLSGTDAGNYTLAGETLTDGEITVRPLSISGTSVLNKVYDGEVTASVSAGTLSGLISGDNVTASATGEFVDANAGTQKNVDVKYALNGKAAGNYSLAGQTLTADITAKALSVEKTSVKNKEYDGTAKATVDLGTVTGFIKKDEGKVTVTAEGKFVDVNAGTDKKVTVTYTVSSTNYTLAGQTLTAVITAKALSVEKTSVDNKEYDATTEATVHVGPVTGFVDKDKGKVTVTATGVFDNKNVGTGKKVTVTYTVSSTNYTLDGEELTADITAKAIAISGSSVKDKVYDGKTDATVVVGVLNGLVGGDVVTASATGKFVTKDAGVDKDVNVTYTLSSKNYTLAGETLKASITQKALTISEPTIAEKTYNGDNVADVTIGKLSGVIDEDKGKVTASATGRFDTKDVGVNKEVTVTYTLSGTESGNYSLASQKVSGTIVAKELTVDGTEVLNKTYDGNRLADVSVGSLVGVVGTDKVTVTATGAFKDKNVGTWDVTVIYYLDGTSSNNYTISSDTKQANITERPLNISGSTVVSKTYDGTTDATISVGTITGYVSGESVTAKATGYFEDANAADGKKVTVTYVLSSKNYSLAGETLTGNIVPKTLSVSGSSVRDKVYDGKTDATVDIGTVTGFIKKDEGKVTVTATGVFEDQNAGTGKKVTVTYTSDSTNYTLAGQTLTANITAAKLTITGSSVEKKEYNGDKVATIGIGTLSGLIGEDKVTVTATGVFEDKNVGTGKKVTVTYSLDSKNYTLAGETLTGEIYAKALGVSGSKVQTRDYDGSTKATVDVGTVSGVVSGDSVTVSASGSFEDKNAGENKNVAVTYTLGGDDKGNYTLADQTLKGTINKLEISVSGTTVDSKTYDGGVSATVHAGKIEGAITGDDISVTGQGEFNDKNVGTSKLVVVSYTSDGKDKDNYAVDDSYVYSSISQKSATVTVNASKALDGYVFEYSLSTSNVTGLVNGATVTAGKIATLRSDVGTYTKEGTDWQITVSLQTSDGASNYAFTYVVSLTITEKPTVVVTPELNQSKVYSSEEPVLTYTWKWGSEAAADDPGFTGTLIRAAGEDVGTYAIRVGTLKLVDNGSFIAANYVLIFESGVNFTITPKAVTESDFNVDLSSETYTGSAITKDIVTSLHTYDYKVVYSDNVHVGTAKIAITGQGNYNGSLSYEFTIVKKLIDVPDSLYYLETGSLITFDIPTSDWYTVADKPAHSGTAAGTYTFKMTLKNTADTAWATKFDGNYHVYITLNIVKHTNASGVVDVEITGSCGIRADLTLVVKTISSDAKKYYIEGETAKYAYEVTFYDEDGNEVQPVGTITLRLLIPQEVVGIDYDVFHIHGQTSTKMSHTEDGAYAVVKTDNFSTFVFAVHESSASDSSQTLAITAAVVLGLIVLTAIGVAAYSRSKAI